MPIESPDWPFWPTFRSFSCLYPQARPLMSIIAETVEQTAINTLRTLSMDAVGAATCGHPGTPMALAPVAYQLWTQHLKYDPSAPLWPNRDRYVLSCGH